MARIVTRNGDKQEFDDRKLYASIYAPAMEAGYDHVDAEELAADVVDQVVDWIDGHEDDVITSTELRERTITVLEEQDDAVAFLYDTHLDLS